MDRNGFGPECTGTLLPIFGGCKAFMPAPLPPPQIDISPIIGLFAKATQNIGELKGIGRTIIDLAFERPVLRVTDIAKRLGVSYQGATNNVKILLGEGVAAEVPGAQLKTIRFPEIIDTLRLN